MALDYALKAAALGDADGVDEVAFGKKGRPDDVAGLHVAGKVPEFLNALDGRCGKLFQMAEQGLRDPMLFLVVKAELDRFVAVTIDRFALDNAVRSCQNDGDRDEDPLSVVDARRAHFLS